MATAATTEMTAQSSPNCRPVEITGRVWGVQLDPPGENYTGAFRLLTLDTNQIIEAPFSEKWWWEILPAFQANDVRHVIVKGIGEHTPDGELQRIAVVESVSWFWAPAPNRLFDTDPPPRITALGSIK